jgi:hypothetical protein
MLATIQLHNELRLATSDIDNERADDKLSREARPIVGEAPPDPPLGLGRIGAQGASAGRHLSLDAAHCDFIA